MSHVLSRLKEDAGKPFAQALPNLDLSKYDHLYEELYKLPEEVVEEVLEQVIEQVVEQIEEEVIETVEPPPEPVIVEVKPDMEPLVAELKMMFLEGFERFADRDGNIAVQELLLEQIKALKEIKETPPPNVEVITPQVDPITGFETTHITRDHNGDIATAKFKLER